MGSMHAETVEVYPQLDQSWRFRNFSFYPSIAPTGLVRAEDSLETETRLKGKKSRKTVRKKEKLGERKKKKANWRRLKNIRENWRK